jgi:hypothetical protein
MCILRPKPRQLNGYVLLLADRWLGPKIPYRKSLLKAKRTPSNNNYSNKNKRKKSMIQKVCGIDVHKDLLVATILNPKTQQKQTMTYKNSLQDIDQLTNWLKQNKCQTAVMESTNIYWKPLYLTLEAAKFQVILANAHQVKAIPGRKTDQKDSE